MEWLIKQKENLLKAKDGITTGIGIAQFVIVLIESILDWIASGSTDWKVLAISLAGLLYSWFIGKKAAVK